MKARFRLWLRLAEAISGIAAAALIMVPVTLAGAATSGQYWTALSLPGSVATSPGVPLSTIACVAANSCVVGGSDGSVEVNGAVSATSSWVQVVAPSGAAVVGTSCPSTTFCAVLDSDGTVRTSSNPLASSGDWTSASVGTSSMMVGLSCATTTACFAIGGQGDFMATSGPSVGTWAASSLPNDGVPTAITCPTTSACFVATDGGQVLFSSNPQSLSPTWVATAVGSGDGIATLSCPSTTFCIAGTDSGQLVTSVDPADALPAWIVQTSFSGTPAIASCGSAAACSAVTDAKVGVMSVNPTGGPSAWSGASIGTEGAPVDALSCTASGYCAGVDAIGEVEFAPNLTTPTWAIAPVNWTTSVTSVSCVANSGCVAGDFGADLLTETSPANLSPWTSHHVAGPVSSVSCASSALCVAGTTNGTLYQSTNPFSGTALWTGLYLGTGNSVLSISCPKTTFCAEIDAANNLRVSNTPTGAIATWTQVTVPDTQGLSTIACTSAGACLIGDLSGSILWSTTPKIGSSWQTVSVANGALTSLSCPTATTCYAGASDGSTYASTNPFDVSPTWTAQQVLDSSVAGISCTSETTCVAMTSEPWLTTDGGATWSPDSVGTAPEQGYGISCTSASCVVAAEGSIWVSSAQQPTAPTFVTALPASTPVTQGAPVTLSVGVVASPSPTYVWATSTNGSQFTTIAGATSASVTLTSAQASATAVEVTVTNALGSVTSTTKLAITVPQSSISVQVTPSVITYGQKAVVKATVTNPSGASATAGTVSFTNGISSLHGCSNLAVKAGKAISCTIASATFAAVTVSYSGNGGLLSPASSVTPLAVKPVVGKISGSGAVKLGAKRTLSVTVRAVTGTTIQWRVLSRGSYVPIEGATGKQYAAPGSAIGSESFDVVVTSGTQVVISSPVTVLVHR